MRKIDLTSFQIATSETARDINRRIVLDLVRTRQPISRADLARCSGLQRSTISLITEQLIEEQWVTEGAMGHAPRGRKPRFLHLNDERARIIGINVRPTMTTIALADLSGRFVAQESIATAADSETFVADLSDRVRDFIRLRPQVFYEGIGVSLPGRVDRSTRRLVFAPNLGWRDVDLKTPLERATGLSVEIENAANACALSEMWFGRHTEGLHDFISLTVSEGIGTGIVTNGQLVRGPTGMAGEFGHVLINEEGPLCRCGNRGCWEATNGTRKNSANRDIPVPTFDDLLRLAAQGDNKAAEALDRMAHYLGVGIAMLVTGFAPSVIIIVGEVTRAWERIGPVIKRVVEKRSPMPSMTRIIPTDDTAHPRLRGTIALILQKHFAAPTIA
jgi:predicted NBD/HSP70 family sugar kinase